uniref:Helicase C-terminal domain-containing protein n=1 Tax=Angiostrongylus cantonensis TaxID=6313 RepID=A0A0K0CZM4_ANGCA
MRKQVMNQDVLLLSFRYHFVIFFFRFVLSQYLCYCCLVLGAILVFLPGFDDITQMRDKILSESWCGRQPVIFTLHSQMNSFDQQKVFESVGLTERKVILSTNIAEASLTIDDVVFVIDCGKVKEKTYDHTSRISQLKVTWIAKSNAEQRCGRAGRCQEGFCFCLYSVEDYDAMLPTQMAEMQRTAIHDVCLHAKMFAPENMTVKQFLQMAPEPPLADSVDKSMAFLEQQIIFGNGSIWPVQTTLYDACLARLLLFGVVLRCLNPVVTLVAALSYRDPCMNSRIFYFMKMIRYVIYAIYSRQLLIELRRVRVISSEGDVMNALRDATYNYYSSCWEMVQAAIVAGCYPGIGFVRAGNKLKKIRTRLFLNSHKISVATLHPSSVIKRQVLSASKRKDPTIEYLAFHELRRWQILIFPPCAVVLFAGSIRLKKSTMQNFDISQFQFSHIWLFLYAKVIAFLFTVFDTYFSCMHRFQLIQNLVMRVTSKMKVQGMSCILSSIGLMYEQPILYELSFILMVVIKLSVC